MQHAFEKGGFIETRAGHAGSGDLVAKDEAAVIIAIPESPVHIIASRAAAEMALF